MITKPVIFISASSDLRSARDLAGKILYSMGYEPVWQEIAATEGGELLDVLRRRLAPCAMVVQLVGSRYGAEPPQRTVEFGRVSYTQFEALEAERLGKRVIYHFLDAGFPLDPVTAEAPELEALQAAYRRRLNDTNHLRYEGIASPSDLELSIRRISDELASLRRRADQRQRKLVRLGGAAAVGIAVIVTLVIALMHRQAETEKKIDDQTAAFAAMRRDLMAAISAKSLATVPPPGAERAAGSAEPPAMSPELVASARLLKERGNAEDQAIAAIATGKHDQADQLLQRLLSNSTADTAKLLTLEGDNWYRAGEPDKALVPYEKAMALKPDDFEARNNVTLANIFARQGDRSAHCRRAVEIATGTLKLVPAGSVKWVGTQNNLGAAWAQLPTGSRAENLKNAAAAFEAALGAGTGAAAGAEDWAVAQNNLGNVWLNIPTGNREENVRKAMAAYEAALKVHSKAADPKKWAMTKNNVGLAWYNLPTGKKGENLTKAIAAYEEALQVYTKESDPRDWGNTQNDLGLAWMEMPTANREENLKKAIAAYENALTVETKESDPVSWAMTKMNLGGALSALLPGDRAGNLKKAAAELEGALTILTKESDPALWATAQSNLGNVWYYMPAKDAAEQSANLKKAIGAYEAALSVPREELDAGTWGTVQINLGNAWLIMPTGNAAENLEKSRAAYEAALTFYTREGDPSRWAMIENDMGNVWLHTTAGDAKENLLKAKAAYEGALTVRTKESEPVGWSETENNMGLVWSRLPTGDREENVKQATAAYEAALTVRTKKADPDGWLLTVQNLITCQLFSKDFAGALATINGAIAEGGADLTLEMMRANALLFLGRVEEAKKIYEAHVGEKMPSLGMTWEDAVVGYFDELEARGVTSPEVAGVRKMLKGAGK